MTHYLYVPFKKRELSTDQKGLIEEWVHLETEQNHDVVVCYHGEKNLNQLTAHAQVSVLLPGKPGKPSSLHGIDQNDTETLRAFPDLSAHLRVTNGKRQSILVPEIADKMMEDGLLNSSASHIQIKLFFLNAVPKETHIMGQAFLNALRKDRNYQDTVIRVDYHANQPETASAPHRMPKSIKKLESFLAQAESNRYSLYNHKENYPQLSLDEVSDAVRNYNQYKSSRCCGLSGLLGLNGLFSSTASEQAIKYLMNKEIPAAERFAYASRYSIRFGENHLAQVLKPILEQSLKNHESTWKQEANNSKPALI